MEMLPVLEVFAPRARPGRCPALLAAAGCRRTRLPENCHETRQNRRRLRLALTSRGQQSRRVTII